ncbi:hypothetical protein O181_007773 [Austropuccinia psidii MF-1]|uniref:Uncharacterized protein n=1 Tax=Austropuccinia psidii MF-1 TaxID=1389203 RepID=A0A9Q3BN45_9BASI|nr:hypothetical protein [Austropuccinia psidii MF-1]
MARARRRRENYSPLPLQATQACQNWKHWPIRVTREDPNVVNEGQDAVARFFRRVYRNSGEFIVYADDRIIPGASAEEMAPKFSWYQDELMDEFQKNVSYLRKDN